MGIVKLTRNWLVDHAAGALVFGRIGDAMGTPTEKLEPEEIERRFGWVETFEGDGTDDSIMANLIADALVRTEGFADADDWAREWFEQRSEIFGPKVDKFFASVIHGVKKLNYGFTPRLVALGNMPSSSSAMAIAPVGIVNAGNPRAAALQAMELASLLHIDDVAYCQDGAAAIAAAVASALGGASVDEVIAASTAYIKPWSGDEMLTRIRKACDIARSTGDYKRFRAAYHAEFRVRIMCDSRETVPAAIALTLLAKGDAVTSVIYGANFGRDADTIACMAGYICGALSGLSAAAQGTLPIPPAISEESTARAGRLINVGVRRARAELEAFGPLAAI